MKKLAKIGIALLAIINFSACTEDDGFTFIAKEDPDGIMFTNTTTGSYTLSTSNRTGLAERFVWNEVDMGVQTPVTYELQGAPTEAFTSMTVLAQGTATNAAVTVSQMLDLAEEAGLDNDPETEAPNSGTIYFRVRAYAGSDAANGVEQFSDVMAVNVVLPEEGGAEEPKMQLYLVGDATAAGWSNDNNNTPLFRDPQNENIFYYEGKFNAGAFKLLETLGAWQPQWGIKDGNFTNSTILGGDPDGITVATEGYYSLTVDTEEMTYTFTEIDASGATNYNTIGLIGPATPGGWDSDTDMTQSGYNPHIWYMNDVELAEGEAKFRANDAWDTSWGNTTFPSGQGANNNDPNIPVSEGTYDVWFNDLSGRYLFIPVE